MTDPSRVPTVVPADIDDLPMGNPDRRGTFEPLVAAIESAAGANPKVTVATYRWGREIRAMRQASGLTQRQLAAAIGVKQSRISEIETGVGPHGPSIELFARIAEACGHEVKLVAKTREYAS